MTLIERTRPRSGVGAGRWRRGRPWLIVGLWAFASCATDFAPDADPGPGGEPLPLRVLSLDFEDPLWDYEANSNAVYSINQLFGKATDHLGLKRGWDDSRSSRLLLGFASFYFAAWAEYNSHEIAHGYELRDYGIFPGADWSLGGWSLLLPTYEQVPVEGAIYYFSLSQVDVFRNTVDGLNQEESNALVNWELSSLEGTLDLQSSISFLCGKLADVAYVLFLAGLEDKRPPWTGQPIRDVDDYCKANGLWNDVDSYTLDLYNWGIDLTKRDYLVQALVADLLSWHTWQSALVFGRYVKGGERLAEASTWRGSGGHAFTPPLITACLTPRGTFYDVRSFLNPRGDHPLMVAIGTDVDFIGDGEVDRFRLGAQYCNLGWRRFRFGPFAYVNTSRAEGYEGASVGIEGSVALTAKVDLRFKVEHNEGDVVENIVKGKAEGFAGRLGIDVTF